MPANKNKSDRLHDLMPSFFKTRQNSNWKAIIEAFGQADQNTADLIEEVRKQFFVKTSSRPYLDRLGANVKVSRPKFVGMDDSTFRTYIPVLSYRPKQVKAIIDSLLDIFFFKESTTAFITTASGEPFALQDGWELEYNVDNFNEERVVFKAADFTNINAATAEEIVASINRQTKHSYSVVFNDSISKKKYVKLFTNTIGARGSIEIEGGRAIIALMFDGFIFDSGNGSDTQWTVTKIGDLIEFKYTAGSDPGIQFLKVGDIIISNLASNLGSFVLENIDIANNSISFRNLFGTAGVFTQISVNDVKFIRPEKFVVWHNDHRAVTWEVRPGAMVVEMPTSPPVVRRSLAGSAHINGTVGIASSRVSNSSLQLLDASAFPNSGQFIIEEVEEIKMRLLTTSENTLVANQNNARLQGFDTKYKYTGKSGNSLTGITPALPLLSSLNEFSLTSLSRGISNNGSATTASAHGYIVGEYVAISGAVDGVNTVSLNGTWKITAVPTTTSFSFFSFGDAGTATGGVARVEKAGIANLGSKVILTTAQVNSRILGPYVWDLAAAFVLSSLTTTIGTQIKAGQIERTVVLAPNSIPNQEGFVVFDYGTARQEGPIRYLYKPNANTIALDPSYVFNFNHDIGSSITMIRNKGPHVMSVNGAEFAPYITDTSAARLILEQLILSVKSVGIFIEFLVRFPEQFYATIDVYGSGVDPG